MSRPNTCSDVDSDSINTDDDEETTKLPSLTAAANDEIDTAAIDQISAKLDELIELNRSINDHLEHLVCKQNAPALAPKKRNRA